MRLLPFLSVGCHFNVHLRPQELSAVFDVLWALDKIIGIDPFYRGLDFNF